jgi:hypothetical protein
MFSFRWNWDIGKQSIYRSLRCQRESYLRSSSGIHMMTCFLMLKGQHHRRSSSRLLKTTIPHTLLARHPLYLILKIKLILS